MMMNMDAEGDPEGVNNNQLTKVARVLRSVTLFAVDVILWSLFWPRGTRFGSRTLGDCHRPLHPAGDWASLLLCPVWDVQSGQESAPMPCMGPSWSRAARSLPRL